MAGAHRSRSGLQDGARVHVKYRKMQSLQCALKLERILVRASRTVALCTTADQLVNFENAAHDLDRSLLRVWPDFITAEEETRLFEEVAPNA